MPKYRLTAVTTIEYELPQEMIDFLTARMEGVDRSGLSPEDLRVLESTEQNGVLHSFMTMSAKSIKEQLVEQMESGEIEVDGYKVSAQVDIDVTGEITNA